MGTKIIKLHIEYGDLGKQLWRDIAVSSNYSLNMLGYVVLATFDTCAYHQFEFAINDKHYEMPDCDFGIMNDEDMASVNLGDILNLDDKFTMDYDYGTPQTFHFAVIGIEDMPLGSGRAYPKVLDGAGCGIIDDLAEDELQDLIHQIYNNGKTDKEIYYKDRRVAWDIKRYSIKDDNALLKHEVERISEGYAPFWEN